MKTANIRMIRLRFPEVLEWLAEEGEVAIEKNGVPVARLLPPEPKKPAPEQWRERFSRPPRAKCKPGANPVESFLADRHRKL